MPTLAKSRRDWPAVLSLGFNIDRNGRRRKPIWTNIVTLGILLPGFAMWGLYRVFPLPNCPPPPGYIRAQGGELKVTADSGDSRRRVA